MQLSAEIRLFWFDHKPAELENWFLDAGTQHCQASGPEVRTDVYLADSDQIELGVKTRGENPGVEVKGLIATPGKRSNLIPTSSRSNYGANGRRQSSASIFRPALRFTRQRWLRKFDTAGARPIEGLDSRPEIGCNVEWTIVTISGEICWTLGFEAFGRLQDVEKSLRTVVRLMNERNPAQAPGGKAMSYPAWIRTPGFLH